MGKPSTVTGYKRKQQSCHSTPETHAVLINEEEHVEIRNSNGLSNYSMEQIRSTAKVRQQYPCGMDCPE
eukprot:13847658-Ditylum_brightwellii.AAC.1